MAKSWKCLICNRLTLKPAVTLQQGVIGPVCAKRVAPKLPMGRAKKLAAPAVLKRRWHDNDTLELFSKTE